MTDQTREPHAADGTPGTYGTRPVAGRGHEGERGLGTGTGRPRTELTGIVLDSPAPRTLAAFYAALLGWTVEQDEPDWVKLAAPGGGPGLSFQTEPRYARPVWPSRQDAPQMSVHLDIRVDDLEAATAHAVALGATLAGYQPQEDVRVLQDPDGHPFCFFLPGA